MQLYPSFMQNLFISKVRGNCTSTVPVKWFSACLESPPGVDTMDQSPSLHLTLVIFVLPIPTTSTSNFHCCNSRSLLLVLTNMIENRLSSSTAVHFVYYKTHTPLPSIPLYQNNSFFTFSSTWVNFLAMPLIFSNRSKSSLRSRP